eukprot:TRINITY_DN10791_c0_g1_i1.p1 TRINITY_DN10791_c0_g1~~TRINITY_DN10791_c0_g1_i1.p1  ORF type:complete len:223 (-),score=40.43 TRINITY_DN10791_c0_g1_i1:17-685(-)
MSSSSPRLSSSQPHPNPNEQLLEAKLVVLGDTGVGKTSIVLQYVENRFNVMSSPTIGASFLSKTLWVDGVRCRLQLWDTAGQERFRSLAPMYYRGAAAAILVYDVTNAESFRKVKEWVKELRTNVFEDIILVLVGNQIDKNFPKVTKEEAIDYATSINALFFETSAKKAIGIEELFLEIAKLLVQSKMYRVQPIQKPVTEKPSQCSCSVKTVSYTHLTLPTT